MGCSHSKNYMDTMIFQPPAFNIDDYLRPIYKMVQGISYVDITPRRTFKPNSVIIFSHGNASDIVAMTGYLTSLSNTLGIRIICYDYPGYGRTPGHPTEVSCLNSLEIIYNIFKDKDIILIGQSLGTGVTICGVVKFKLTPKLVILISPYTSLHDVIGVGSLNSSIQSLDIPIFNTYANIKYFDYIKCPVKIYHGKNDNIIPSSHSVSLSERIPNMGKLFILEDTDHYNILEKIEMYPMVSIPLPCLNKSIS